MTMSIAPSAYAARLTASTYVRRPETRKLPRALSGPSTEIALEIRPMLPLARTASRGPCRDCTLTTPDSRSVACAGNAPVCTSTVLTASAVIAANTPPRWYGL